MDTKSKYPENRVLLLSRAFAIKIVEYSDELNSRHKYVISNQLIRSGTAIGAMIHEAQNAESRFDFIHKIKIAAKEASETEYWLGICEGLKTYPPVGNLNREIRELILILASILKTAINKNQNH